MRSFILVVFSILSFVVLSCEDYLDVVPKGEVIPRTIADYELMFNSVSMTDLAPVIISRATDDIYISSGTEETGTEANTYFWKKYIDEDTDANPQVWQEGYTTLYYSNVIINNIMDAEEGSQAEKQMLMGQALTIRALNYFYLLTTFANAYDPDLNPDDMGVPLVSSINVTDATPPRSTLKECFDLIIRDLVQALEWLPEAHKDRWRVTRYGAAGVLSRIYLYMGDYEKADEYAQIALQSDQENKIADYNTMTPDSLPVTAQNSEKIWVDYGNVPGLYTDYSQDLRSYFDDEDGRIRLLTGVGDDSITYRSANIRNTGIGYPEMYLNRAEFLVRDGQIEEGMEIINRIRDHRLPEDHENRHLEADNREDALRLVLEERRRELAFTGTRWMDMKRLDREGMMPAVHRYMNNDSTRTVIATLEPGSDQYTFEIPIKVITFNPDIVPNHQ